MVGSALRALVAAAVVALGAHGTLAGQDKAPAEPPAEAVRFFESKVRPLLAEHCFQCHGEKKQKGGLRLDSRAALLAGGDQGPAIVPGDPERSLLVQAVRYQGELKMPPERQLSREQVADLVQWVRLGAAWPGAGTAGTTVRKGDKQITEADRAHWSFQPVRRPPVPEVKDRDWVRNPIDAFLLAKLEGRGLRPNPPAERHELVRRLYYNVTGLPPTPQQLQQALADPSPAWYEKLVDELLQSPRYGEKWARHWLDLVRFAETNSYERDHPKPNAWRYRDYVIRSFNADKPFDQFIREQLAGDELVAWAMEPGADASRSLDASEAIIATGYYRLGIWDDEPTDPLQANYDGLDDIVATAGQVFLGLTLDCARCHEHKIDPVPQRDYYRFLAFFHNINHFRNGGPSDEQPIFTSPAGRQAYEAQVKALAQRKLELQTPVADFEEEFTRLYAQVAGKAVAKNELPKLIRAEGARLLGAERYQRYDEQKRELEALAKQKVAAAMALCVTEAGSKPPDTFVLLRGNPHVRGEKVEPGFPQVLGTEDPVLPAPPPGARSSGRRLVLADWIASARNPLTARVLVNRLWQHHFGRGIVRTPNDFGLQGSRPTHPELLDWLASELVASGERQQAWTVKRIHRLILTSNAYRMSSRGNAEALAADPMNDLFWRFDMRRLSAEEIRDSVLAVSGNLNLKMHGPGIYPEMPKEVLATQSMPGKGWGRSPPEEQARRSIYVHVKRSLLLPILDSFDLADTDRSAAVRFSSTQPTQALLLLNSDFLNRQAGILAERLKKEAGSELDRQVRLALHLATCRPPREAEVKRGLALIRTLQNSDGASPDQALRCFCLMVLNLNEFIYLD